MSHHDTAAHDTAAHGGAHAHSHKKHYILIGVILTVVTAIELGIPFIKDLSPNLWTTLKELWAPLLVALSVFKFGAVVGEFMHLRGDDRVYKVVFISPLILAMLSFCVLGLMAVTHYGPFGEGPAITNVDVAMGYRKASKGAEAPPAPPEDQLKLAFDDLAKTGHDKGKAIFAAKCASCHGDNAEGQQKRLLVDRDVTAREVEHAEEQARGDRDHARVHCGSHQAMHRGRDRRIAQNAAIGCVPRRIRCVVKIEVLL